MFSVDFLLPSCLDELASSRTGTLRCHRVKSVHMLPFSQRALSSFSKEKFTPFCLIVHKFTWVASFHHLTPVCLGIRQAWVWQRSQPTPSSSSTNSECSKIMWEDFTCTAPSPILKLPLMWSAFQRLSETSSDKSMDFSCWPLGCVL